MTNDKTKNTKSNKKDETPNFTWAGLFILLITVFYFIFIVPIMMKN
jgi:hypothetical protein